MDESGTARQTAATLGLPNTQVIVPESVENDFDRIVAGLDEPFADPSSFPTCCATLSYIAFMSGGSGLIRAATSSAFLAAS